MYIYIYSTTIHVLSSLLSAIRNDLHSTFDDRRREREKGKNEDPFKKEREAVVEEKKKCETINAKGVRSEIAER